MRKQQVALILGLAIAFALIFEASVGNVAAPAGAVVEEEGTVFRSVDPCGKVALTCNVDWGEEEIPKILKILKEQKVKITFFVSGAWAEKHPDLLRRMYVEGHEIGSHGYGHKLCSQISTEQIREELEKTEQAIEPLLDGEQLSLFAPPSGDYDEKTVDLCRELGYKLTLWSADTIDWKEGSTAEVITKRVLKKNLDGAIVLMHPKPETVKALPQILDGIEEKGLVPGRLYDLEIY